jgi:hypothetical protein
LYKYPLAGTGMIQMTLHGARGARLRPLMMLMGFACASTHTIGGEIDLFGPAGSGRFGATVAVLPNGNIVVGDPLASSDAAAHVGAVYLFSPSGNLISTLRGSSAEDSVGASPVFVLPDGNFVVATPSWDNAGATDAGAVTWVSGTSGLDGVVGGDNSLVGTSAGDGAGFDVVVLANGSYVVSSPAWNNGSAQQAGAATWVPADGSVRGGVSPANSLVGLQSGDGVGQAVVALANGNYLVVSSRWSNGTIVQAGAITWANGTTGISGPVSPENSLVGGSAGDTLGSQEPYVVGIVHTFANGNAVAGSPNWQNGSLQKAGAVTWIDGANGITGFIAASNSLIGMHDHQSLGAGAFSPFTDLPGGRYAIRSDWRNETGDPVGAFTWADSASPIVGEITPSNSLVGTIAGDLSIARIFPLLNDNWVVAAPYWNNGTEREVGAATWIDGSQPLTGALTPANSLTGTSAYDHVGQWITPLTDGNYVVASPGWSDSTGAATWADGTATRSGVVSSANSLVGAHPHDLVAWGANSFEAGGVVALEHGHYVVLAGHWSSESAAHVGAITWCGGASCIGEVSAKNSLVGDVEGDNVGWTANALDDGRVVVSSPYWHARTGAASLIDGSGAQIGTVSADNSLVGRTPSDGVTVVTPIAGGIFYVSGENWSFGSEAPGAGAVVRGEAGTPLLGEVTPAIAFHGTHAMEAEGHSVAAVGNNRVVITSEYAVTLAHTDSPLLGTPNAENSALALAPGLGIPGYEYDGVRDRLVIGWAEANYVAILDPDVLFRNGFD